MTDDYSTIFLSPFSVLFVSTASCAEPLGLARPERRSYSGASSAVKIFEAYSKREPAGSQRQTCTVNSPYYCENNQHCCSAENPTCCPAELGICCTISHPLCCDDGTACCPADHSCCTGPNTGEVSHCCPGDTVCCGSGCCSTSSAIAVSVTAMASTGWLMLGLMVLLLVQ